ncbi:MAG: pyridoxamine 5-phosphate oxidase-related FMN-binding protein [Gemmatimonadetes bacterium]|nr:pyridoxamine 5-phosphate oxidase-related FMN-binding protein [Gemmatimonadota bacterium]
MTNKTPSTTKKLDELYDLIGGIEIAMFTTRRADGQLVSRPMATQERVTGTDLWFVTDISANKLDELESDPHVNLAYYNNKSREWVSVAGTAQVTQDRNLIKELYKPDWKAWFGDQGGDMNGGADDPRLALILVEAQSVEYMVTTKPRPVVLFEVAKGIVTGTPPKVGEQRSLTERELHTEAAREAR